MTKDTCGYASQGGCSPYIVYTIKDYFATGRSLKFCEKHGKDWNDLHPFGPLAKKIREVKE